MRDRGFAFGVAALVALGAVIAVLLASDDGWRGTASAQTATGPGFIPPKPPPYKRGRLLKEPPVVRSHNGKLKVALLAKNGAVKVSGVTIHNTQTYALPTHRRHFLGPTLHANPGELVDLTLDNELTRPKDVLRSDDPPRTPTAPQAQPNCPKTEPGHAHAHGAAAPTRAAGGGQYTNLHFHGLHVTTRTRHRNGKPIYGDNVLLNLPRGKSHFRFRIPKNHDQGTFWYHAHRHGCTDDQVYRGLAGVLLIGDSRKKLPRRFRHIRTRTLALKDIQAVPYKKNKWAIPNDFFWGGHLTQRTVNGMVQPRIRIAPGETQLWRVMDVSNGVWYRIAIAGGKHGKGRDTFTVVSQDGNPQTRLERRRTVLLGPGHRDDILVRGARANRTLETLPFNQGDTTFPLEKLASVEAVGRRRHALRVPSHGVPLPRFPRKRGNTRYFVFSFSPNGTPFKALINDQQFDPNLKHAYVRPRDHTTEKWVLINLTTQWHPIHIHQDDHRVLSVNGRRVHDPPGDQDIVNLPPQSKDGRPGRVVIEMPFTIRGDFVMHCHILDHEDAGMMVPIVVR